MDGGTSATATNRLNARNVATAVNPLRSSEMAICPHADESASCRAPRCRLLRPKVGRWTMLVDQLLSLHQVAPAGCQVVYLVTEVLFLAMLQVPRPVLSGECCGVVRLLRLIYGMKCLLFSGGVRGNGNMLLPHCPLLRAVSELECWACRSACAQEIRQFVGPPFTLPAGGRTTMGNTCLFCTIR